jgi:hypothetical protein
MKILYIGKRNKTIIAAYLFIMSLVVFGYLLFMPKAAEGYDASIFRDGYVYMMTFSTLVYALLVMQWNVEDSDGIPEIFSGSILLCLSVLPLVLSLFIVGELKGVMILTPFAVQVVWGLTILSLKKCLLGKNVSYGTVQFVLVAFSVAVLFASMAFIYVYCIYGQLVVTAVFDNNFPSFFFINPVFLVYGLTRVQMGEVNYLGNNPLVFNILFWIGASLLLQAVSVLNRGKNKKNDDEVTAYYD